MGVHRPCDRIWRNTSSPDQARVNDIIDAAVRHYAFEAQCFVLSATGVLTPEVIESLGPVAKEKLKPGGGASPIVGPGGKYIARAESDGELVLYGELEFDSIIDWKQLVDSMGHYARPDVAQLHLRKERLRPLVFDENALNQLEEGHRYP